MTRYIDTDALNQGADSADEMIQKLALKAVACPHPESYWFGLEQALSGAIATHVGTEGALRVLNSAAATTITASGIHDPKQRGCIAGNAIAQALVQAAQDAGDRERFWYGAIATLAGSIAAQLGPAHAADLFSATTALTRALPTHPDFPVHRTH